MIPALLAAGALAVWTVLAEILDISKGASRAVSLLLLFCGWAGLTRFIAREHPGLWAASVCGGAGLFVAAWFVGEWLTRP
jgi:hypothetical protein